MIHIPICTTCGGNADAKEHFCPACGAPLTPVPGTTSPLPPDPVPGTPAPADPAREQNATVPFSHPRKNAGLAAAASLFWAGLGQVYNGSLIRGLLFFLFAFLGMLIFPVVGIIFWLAGIIDAYVTAKKMEDGRIPFVPCTLLKVAVLIAISVAVFFVYFFILMASVRT